MKYFLSLGSNIDPESNLDLAISALKDILTETECSSVYTTQAEGFDGDDFLNLILWSIFTFLRRSQSKVKKY